jgi:hypothetical protein
MTDGEMSGAVWEALHAARAPGFNGTFNEFCNTIIATGFMLSVTGCTDAAAISQQIYTTCTGDPSGSAGCRSCLNARATMQRARADLNDEWFKESGEIADEFDEIDCRVACKSCVAVELKQEGVVNVTTNCVNNTEFITKMKAGISSAVAQDVQSKNDVFGSIIPGDNLQIRNSLANTISSTVTQEFITRLLARCVAVQKITLRGSSMMVSRTTQSINVRTVSTLVAQSRSTVISYGQIQVAAAQALLQENKTVESMLKLVSAPLIGVVDMITSTMFMLMLVAIVIAAIGAVGVAIYLAKGKAE